MLKKIWGAVIVVITLASILFYVNTSATVVQMAAVEVGNIKHTVVDTGYVQAAEDFSLYAQQSGTIKYLPVAIGQNVSKQELIMVLENRDLIMSSQQMQIQLSQAQAAVSTAQSLLAQGNLDLQNAQVNFNRAQELFTAGAISQAEYDLTRSQVEKYQQSMNEQNQNLQAAHEQINSYQALLNSSKQMETELTIKSPIDGVLMQLPVKLGQAVVPGTLLGSIAMAGNLEIKADLLSDDLGEVILGQKVLITAPVLGDEVLNGEVIKIYPQAEEKTSALGVIQRRVPTIIKLESTGNLKPGYETRVNIITASRDQVMLVPRESILTAANGEKQVMAVAYGSVVYKTVKTGLMDSKNIEITEGLNAGDQIIKDASVVLKEKTRVKAL